MKIIEIDTPEAAVSVARDARRATAAETVEADVKRIIAKVRAGGESALVTLTRELDGADVSGGLEVLIGERKSAWDALDPELGKALGKAAGRIRSFAEKTSRSDWFDSPEPGIETGQVVRPFKRAGIYVPGGRFAYPSTVLMTGIPAAVAGVGEIVFCIPPADDGVVPAASLAASTLVEGSRVFRIGGAQAVAAMAYGTGPLPACRLIAGPGNVYVTEAKRQVSGDVAIDMLAGPSEIAVYIEEAASARLAAADLLSQLEHDPGALAVCVAASIGLLEAVDSEASSLAGIGGADRIRFVKALDRETAVAFLNELAPEHLGLLVEGARDMLSSIESAGCVFLGPCSGVALGDYVAGPSHVLPTGGLAAFRGGLGAADFQHLVNVVEYDAVGVGADASDALTLAGAEGMEMHARSIEERSK